MPRRLVRGPPMALLGGVVVDDVEDDLESGFVQELHHALELAQDRLRSLAAIGLRGVGAVRGEEVQGVVAPVVGEPVLQQARLGREGVDREQLDARHAQREEVLDHRRMRQTGVRAVESRRHIGMPLRHALEVALVDHGPVHRHPGLGDPAPIESAVDDDRPPVLESARHQSLGVRLDQERARVEQVAGTVRAVDADRVARAHAQEGCRDAPHVAADGPQRDGVGDPVEVRVIEHDQFDVARAARPDAQRAAIGPERDTESVERGTQ